MKNSEHKCSFCGKTVSEVKKMIVGGEGCICDYCVAMVYMFIEKDGVDMMRTSERVKRDLAKLEDQK
jgi:ATP-dependent protease Clp ATPase subunit